ncbi:restriction endonuclease [Kitasatospora acidiphila]|uniref:Restriction endonuclease n=1 Tax=Kitasatospora acidiphila TaxID=2567942 RepID=A0A540VX39_9ACTN|nr:restriction endonuclease [Kitasatospora acidiphila]TQF01330.1 restriction endonuclease [Kitasatospora acidiphila]
MARRRSRLRKPHGTTEYIAAAVFAAAVLSWLFEAAKAAFEAAARHWPVLVALAVACAAIGAAVWARSRRAARLRTERLAMMRLTLAQIDAMGDQDFEFALRDLLVRDGWKARKVGQQGDQAADVIGQHPDLGRIVLQAKHTKVRAKVGSQVMYQVKGTAGPAHGANIAVVVTNGAFTRDAAAWGNKHHVHWVDRDRLRAWAEHGIALHDLLRLPAATPKRQLRRSAA